MARNRTIIIPISGDWDGTGRRLLRCRWRARLKHAADRLQTCSGRARGPGDYQFGKLAGGMSTGMQCGQTGMSVDSGLAGG